MSEECTVELVKIALDLGISDEITAAILSLLKSDSEKMAMIIMMDEYKTTNQRKLLTVAKTIMDLYKENPTRMKAQLENQLA